MFLNKSTASSEFDDMGLFDKGIEGHAFDVHVNISVNAYEPEYAQMLVSELTSAIIEKVARMREKQRQYSKVNT